MALQGMKNVQANLSRFINRAQGENTRKVLTAIAMTGAGYAKLETPVDTATLINSQYYEVNGNQAIVGYKSGFSATGFNYAKWLHDNTNWSPIKKNAAKPFYLANAFESQRYKKDYLNIITQGYKL